MACSAALVHWDEVVPPESALEQLDPVVLALTGAVALVLMLLALRALRRRAHDRGSR